MIIVLAILVIVVIAVIQMANGLKSAEVKIDEALSGIDVALVKRYDVLTSSLDALKGLMKFEKELTIETIELRKGTMRERSETLAKMDQTQSQIFAVGENYPQIKSSESFKELQRQIQDCEEHLQAARRAYNANVSLFNQKIVSFPSSLIANMMNMCSKEFFEAESHKKENVKIDL